MTDINLNEKPLYNYNKCYKIFEKYLLNILKRDLHRYIILNFNELIKREKLPLKLFNIFINEIRINIILNIISINTYGEILWDCIDNINNYVKLFTDIANHLTNYKFNCVRIVFKNLYGEFLENNLKDILKIDFHYTVKNNHNELFEYANKFFNNVKDYCHI